MHRSPLRIGKTNIKKNMAKRRGRKKPPGEEAWGSGDQAQAELARVHATANGGRPLHGKPNMRCNMGSLPGWLSGLVWTGMVSPVKTGYCPCIGEKG